MGGADTAKFLLLAVGVLTLVGYSAFKTTFLRNASTAPLAVKVGAGAATIYGPIFVLWWITYPIALELDPLLTIVLYTPIYEEEVVYFVIAVPLIVSGFLILYEIWTRLKSL